MSERDEAFEAWLRSEVLAAHDELEADPSQGRNAEQVLQRLADERKGMEAGRESYSPEGEVPYAHLHKCTPATRPRPPLQPCLRERAGRGLIVVRVVRVDFTYSRLQTLSFFGYIC